MSLKQVWKTSNGRTFDTKEEAFKEAFKEDIEYHVEELLDECIYEVSFLVTVSLLD